MKDFTKALQNNHGVWRWTHFPFPVMGLFPKTFNHASTSTLPSDDPLLGRNVFLNMDETSRTDEHKLGLENVSPKRLAVENVPHRKPVSRCGAVQRTLQAHK